MNIKLVNQPLLSKKLTSHKRHNQSYGTHAHQRGRFSHPEFVLGAPVQIPHCA